MQSMYSSSGDRFDALHHANQILNDNREADIEDDPINTDQSIQDVIANLDPREQLELRNIDNSYNSYSWNNGNSENEEYGGAMGLDSLNAGAYDSQQSPSHPYQHRNNNNNNNNSSNFFDDANMNMSLGDVGRMNRIAHAEVAIRQEMFKECTFRPQIKPLPTSYGTLKDTGTQFLDRVNKWTKERDADLKKKSDAMSRSEMADCTFTPRLSKTSERTIREMRGNVAEDFSDRLYKSSSLYTEQRYKLIESERAREEAIERQECTFQPQLATSRFNQANGVNPKFRKPVDDRRPKTPENKESFTPQVNKIKPYMNSAKAYVSTNVVDRLSKPINQQNLPNQPATPTTPVNDLGGVFENNRPVMDVNAFMNNSQPETIFKTRQFTSSLSTYNRVDTEEKKKPALSEDEKKARKLQFEQFIHRQQQNLKTKDLSVKLMEKAITPSFEPKFSKKSMQINEERFKGDKADFVNRLERDLQKRLNNEEGLGKASLEASKEETFQPVINAKSQKMRPRSSLEMSRGDQYRKEASVRLTKLQQEQEQMEEISFKPKIFTEKYQKNMQAANKAPLSLAQDPEAYLEWHRHQELERDSARKEELRRRDEEEVRDCTFAPSTIDCPEYVKRIAKSMAIVKAAKGSASSVPKKPDWL